MTISEEHRVAKIVGAFIWAMGALTLFFTEILDFAVETGLGRYQTTTGQLASGLFSGDQKLIGLLQIGEVGVWLLFILGILICVAGFFLFWFPATTVQILKALKVLSEDSI